MFQPSLINYKVDKLSSSKKSTDKVDKVSFRKKSTDKVDKVRPCQKKNTDKADQIEIKI